MGVNYDLKPRKSKRNIPKKYELKNKSLGEQPGGEIRDFIIFEQHLFLNAALRVSVVSKSKLLKC